jgi:hypothetical protein
MTCFCCAVTAHAGCDLMPPILPLNGDVFAGTCTDSGNGPCNEVQYPSPIATSRFTLDEPSTMEFVISSVGAPAWTPTIYLSGGVCDEGPCGPHLPAGSYCMTVTASPFDGDGACGCFGLHVETAVDDDTLFRSFFETP